jgi:hypothetical protein
MYKRWLTAAGFDRSFTARNVDDLVAVVDVLDEAAPTVA